LNLKTIRTLHECKKKTIHGLLSGWYWLMKPIAYLYEKNEARQEKKRDTITKEQALRWIAEDIAKYLVTNNKGEKMTFIIADYFDKELLSDYFSLRHIDRRFLKRKKTQMGYCKFNIDSDDQRDILAALSDIKGIRVNEEIETFKWHEPRNYQGTFYVSYKG
jgi:hypothetical protein